MKNRLVARGLLNSAGLTYEVFAGVGNVSHHGFSASGELLPCQPYLDFTLRAMICAGEQADTVSISALFWPDELEDLDAFIAALQEARTRITLPEPPKEAEKP